MRVDVLLGAACLTLIAGPASAGPALRGNLANPMASFAPPPPPPGSGPVVHHSLGVVINENVVGGVVSVPQLTFTDTDALTQVKCPEKGGCTINFRLWGLVEPAKAGRWGFCSWVDDAQAANTCFFINTLRAGDGMSSGSSFGTHGVAKGAHQIRTRIYMEGGGDIITWHHEYEVTAP